MILALVDDIGDEETEPSLTDEAVKDTPTTDTDTFAVSDTAVRRESRTGRSRYQGNRERIRIMINKLNNLKTPVRIAVEVAIVIVITALSITAYAVISDWISGGKGTDLEIGDVFSGHIEQVNETGKVSPGDSILVHPVLTNTGSVPALGFIKLTYPTHTTSSGAVESIYSWEVGSGWTVVEQGDVYTVYGYETVLNHNESTTELCDGMVMKNGFTYDELLGGYKR